MGGKNSREERPSFRNSGSFQSSSSFGGSQYGGAPQPYSYPPQNIPQHSYSYPPQEYPVQEAYPAYPQQYPAAPPPAQVPARPQKKFDRRYSRIADNYSSLEQVELDVFFCMLNGFIYCTC